MSTNPPKFKLQEIEMNNELQSYPSLLGKQNWSRLHPDIQKRFGEEVHQPVTYQGMMSEIYASSFGKLLAQLCRLIGTPLATHSGIDVPTMVKVYPNSKLKGMTWDRFYAFENKPVTRVKSAKCIQEKVGLVEMVGFGFGMELDVSVKGGGIYFESQRFFWQKGKVKFIIPKLLTPGKTVVSQNALANGSFEFRLDVTHPILGQVFKQIGVFERV